MDYTVDPWSDDWRRIIEHNNLATLASPLAVAVTGPRYPPLYYVDIYITLPGETAITHLALSPADAIALRDALTIAIPMIS